MNASNEPIRSCEFCGKPVPEGAGTPAGNRIFCSETCLWSAQAGGETTDAIFLAMEEGDKPDKEGEPGWDPTEETVEDEDPPDEAEE